MELNAASGLVGWLQATPLSHVMRGPLYYPVAGIFHVLGFILLVGTVVMFDLRVLGFNRRMPVRQLASQLLPWSAGGVLLVLPAGLLMFSAHPEQYVDNPLFLLKLSLIALAGLNAAAFHLGAYRRVDQWNVDITAPLSARLHAVLSICLWVTVVCCGRLLSVM